MKNRTSPNVPASASRLFADQPKSVGEQELRYSGGQIFRASAPFIVRSLFVCAWDIKPVTQALDQISELAFGFQRGQPDISQWIDIHLPRHDNLLFDSLRTLSAAGCPRRFEISLSATRRCVGTGLASGEESNFT